MEEDILSEVRRVREQMARECDFDVAKLMERYRRAEDKAKAEGWKFVDRSAQHTREAPAVHRQPAASPTES